MERSGLREGALIEGHRWAEPVEVKKVEEFGDDTRIVGSMASSGSHVDVILSAEELEHVSLKRIDCDFSGEPSSVFLALETIRFRFASEYDPLLAMHTSKVHPLPHQIEAVYGRVLKMPRIRFLLAHDPGAGKTIMAGLIIKEMKLRQLAKHVLIVVPGHLKDQWRRELKDKFQETFMVVDRSTTNAMYGVNVWERERQIITSMDFAKRSDVANALRDTEFDLVVVDEAHKMAAYRYGNKIDRTSRYKLGEMLSNNSEHLLFLTATPHKGDDENFRLFLDLLEPGFFATTKMLQEALANDENNLFMRQIKEDMRDLNGKPLFPPRHVTTTPYRLSDPERNLYRGVTEYVRNQFNMALAQTKRRNIGFALMVLQRRLASSSYALYKSLSRRKARLSKMLSDFEGARHPIPKMFSFEETDDMNEEDRWEQEKIWEALSMAQNRDELEREIKTLDGLVVAAKDIVDKEHEVKLRELKKTMEGLDKKHADEKILVFTESKDTLLYLEQRVRSWGYDVSVIHGGMKLDERIVAEKMFQNESRVMIATEAAGEGINLQFCHLMINYDIPWNPNRLEQRMGRVHRYGQNYEVYVYNLIAQDTIEGKMFRKLFDKLNEIRTMMGNDRVYDIIGNVYYGKDLAQLLTDAATGARTEEEILKDIDIVVDNDYIQKITEDLADTLATKNIDFSQITEIRERAKENRLIPEYTADLFIKAFEKANGKIRERPGGVYAIDSIPSQIRQITREDEFVKSFGPTINTYPKITFRNKVGSRDHDAEFLTFGHPLFEAILEWISREFTTDLHHGAIFVDNSGQLDGMVLFYEGSIKDGTGRVAGKRLFSYYVNRRTSEVEDITPSIMWDLDGSAKHKKSDTVEFGIQKSIVEKKVIGSLRVYQKEILEEMERQGRIKKRYGIKSLEKLIRDLDSDLVSLRERQMNGENMDIAIHNKVEKQNQYIESKKHLSERIEQEKSLTVNTPKLQGIIRVIPSDKIPDIMSENRESEHIAMAVVMAYEREHGREPTDVSGKRGLGYDIKSVSGRKTRYIEVKGRYKEGGVSLTHNEWFRAKHLKEDYYLYVVWNTKDALVTDLQPLVIPDPAHNTNPKTDTHYILDVKEIRSNAI